MDREIAPEIRRRRIGRRAAASLIAVAAVTFCVAATLRWLRPSARLSDLQLATVERGPVEETLQASGTVVPLEEIVIASPIDTRMLRIDRAAGDRVRAGDVVVTLDTSSTRLDAERIEGSLLARRSEDHRLRLRLEESVATLRAQLEQKKLDRDILHYAAEQNRKLFDEGLVSEQAKLAAITAAKKADIELAQLAAAIGRAERAAEAELAASRVQLSTLEKERTESERQFALSMMRAPRDGVVTWAVPETGASVRRGDVVARISDLSSYRVAATISDLHASRIAAGMRVRVRLDGGVMASGRVASVDPRIEKGTVGFRVDLDQSSHPKLRNNLRVDVFVVTRARENALRVARGELGRSAREDVLVLRDDRLVRLPVRWGLVGEETMEAASGLRAGDRVLISNAEDFEGLKEIRIR